MSMKTPFQKAFKEAKKTGMLLTQREADDFTDGYRVGQEKGKSDSQREAAYGLGYRTGVLDNL